MARAAAGCLIFALGTVSAVAIVGGAKADEPIHPGQPATVYVTVRVERAFHGHTARQWAASSRRWRRHYVQADRDRDTRGRTIHRLRDANREHLDLGPDGLARAFVCIHSFEGSWQDAGAPYWGGVQMDRNFMSAYGAPFYRALGTADRWPPFVQVAVAMAAYYSGRGFHPWPLTARMCGLL